MRKKEKGEEQRKKRVNEREREGGRGANSQKY